VEEELKYQEDEVSRDSGKVNVAFVPDDEI
jgi:hypothetical protein